MKRSTRLGLGLPFALLVGCAQPDRVLFVTGTQIDLGYDASLSNLNIGYDRNELVVGPADPQSGTLPPVYAYIASDVGIVQTAVKQLYATGKAAVSVAAAPPATVTCVAGTSSGGTRKVMVFGTTTHFGLKAHFVGETPDSVSLGFKRKEFSLLPVEDPGKLGSVLAGLDLKNTLGIAPGTGVGVKQVIATGAAAECFAQDPDINRNFKAAAKDATKDAAQK